MAKLKEYNGENITVLFDARRCIHAAECVKALPAVFSPDTRPWVRADGAAADEVAQVVQRCPSGALSYRRTDGGMDETPALEPGMELVKDGPVYVRGDVPLLAPDGAPIPTPPRAALCRCGQSRNKPFCDNSHIEAGFSSEDGS